MHFGTRQRALLSHHRERTGLPVTDIVMRVCVALEHRFHRLPDGSVWTQSQYGMSFWRRYLDVFDEVRCLARIRDVQRLDGEWRRSDGPDVAFHVVPPYVGAGQFLTHARRVRAAVRQAVRPGDAFVLRVPGMVGSVACQGLKALRYPYGVEVVGDPFDVFSKGAVRHPLRRFFRWHGTRQLQRQCADACAASYVTSRTLQRRYPSRRPAVAASTVELPDEAFVAAPRTFDRPATNLVFVGSLEHWYKAADVLISAFNTCVNQGADLYLKVVGDGKHRAVLEDQAAQLGCRDRIDFLGQLPAGARVREQLDAADLFVLPSRQEGLPRATIEAMARGLPCIGSRAGGIPELLPDEALVPAGDAGALANKICEVSSDPSRMTRMSADNLDEARAYRSAVLQPRRVEFYLRVREETERWLRGRVPPVGVS